ncbi:hypothetical protein [Desulfobacula phenolica]|uniref:Biopolymer transport protein ExbD n=1 Tax=Desulfobacula phenolica TaxID=90732 RepID=A0A1H2JKR2_9BACT|nr:hypothetical protein [Desulfobacula phenolica]SDU57040.1 hypothetical protein SAMN04487931_11360 [Desulfobacula phenolica]
MRRRQSINISLAAGDPGKDLFAYLFLLIMVFSFMLIMSLEQPGSAQAAPDRKKRGGSTFSKLAKQRLATLENRDSKIYLRFGKDIYDPQTDLKRLEQDKRIVIKKQGKTIQKILYIKKTKDNNISLSQYLETFKSFSDHNISIAFAVTI